ncbi:MAG: response regulator transcription factor [Monoglobus pectinilyticus]|uniref:response regulator transcription factor n=1 Tax=Monoglobus pectinilyticus TaxID=1981510 RepID=UPI00399A43AD
MKKILLLEDDASLIDGLKYSLSKNGFSADFAGTVNEAKLFINTGEYDLLLLDVTLPDGTGFEICDYVRSTGNTVPIIFLTASDEEVNIIRGLDSGADDYITKPFKLAELFSRINALMRRAGITSKKYNETAIKCGDVTVDLLKHNIIIDGRTLELTGAEYKLLLILIRNANIVVTRNMILNELWDCDEKYVDDNTLSVYIHRLREKVENDPSKPQHLITVRGFGYKWNEVGL